MSISRFEAEKFSGKNDFGLWLLKMKAMLVQQGLSDALKADPKGKEEEIADPKERAKKEEILERAHSAIILNLGDKVLEKWPKKHRLQIVEEKGIEEQLDMFNKTIDDLENIDVKMEDEDKAIILLNALPKSFEQLKDAILYGRETSITMEEVQSALKCKELQKQNGKLPNDSVAKSLNIKAGKGKKGFKKKFVGPKQSQTYKGGKKWRRKQDLATIVRNLAI